MATVLNLQNALIVGPLEHVQAILKPKGASIVQAQGCRIIIAERPLTAEEVTQALKENT